MSNGNPTRPQAQDDFTVIGEDVGFVVIDVLGNDRGNPDIIWSVDQEDPTVQN